MNVFKQFRLSADPASNRLLGSFNRSARSVPSSCFNPFIAVVMRWIVCLIVVGFTSEVLSDQDEVPANQTTAGDKVYSGLSADSPAVADEFISDFDDQDLVGSHRRAWEYRPYRVAVWFCLDGTPVLNSSYRKLAADVTRRSELMDPSGWDLTTGLAPPRWRNRFLKFIGTPEKFHGLIDLPSLEAFDKLMVVCLQNELGQTRIRVREFDIQTQLWGPLLVRDVALTNQLSQKVMELISIAFMPLARIDRVQQVEFTDDQGHPKRKVEVVMQIRAIRSCVRSDLNGDLLWEAETNKDSPVAIKDDDRFLPVIRRTDRQGNLMTIEPIEFTFLTVDDQQREVLKASIESYHRAPLNQRKSKRAQKLALVIRPLKSSTKLKLVSGDKRKLPMEGLEIWSRRPGQPKEEPSAFIGKTDWQGSIEIPPSDDGLRLIYVKRGSRALKKLPIMPGLYASIQSTLPSDEARLFAEGVIQGLQKEILSLVIRRQVLENDIAAAIEKKQLDLAKTTFREFQKLETPRELMTRMSDDEIRLKSQTSNPRELDYINRMFNNLRKILNDLITKSKKVELQEAIQRMIQAKTAQVVPSR